MLDKLGFSGEYRDRDISVDIMLENPLEYGIDAGNLLFSIKISQRSADAPILRINEFSFYIMDKYNRMYNVQDALVPTEKEAAIVLDCSISAINGHIQTKLRPIFLYHDIRIAFYYQLYNRIEIITLTH